MSPKPSPFDQQLPSRVYSEEDRQLRWALIIEAILRDPGPDTTQDSLVIASHPTPEPEQTK